MCSKWSEDFEDTFKDVGKLKKFSESLKRGMLSEKIPGKCVRCGKYKIIDSQTRLCLNCGLKRRI